MKSLQNCQFARQGNIPVFPRLPQVCYKSVMIWTPAYRVFTDQVSRPAFGWTLLAVLMALALAVAGKLVADRLGIPDTELFRDPAAEFDIPSYAGLFSYLGISSLFATAAVAGATAIVVPTVRSICVSVSALSVFLALDDLLL
ncbi:MAG: hypothetical protein AAGA06_12365, partial [Pseudomonadota bacterium]